MVTEGERFGPSFEEGCRADQANAALLPHQRGGEVRPHHPASKSDLPGRADMKVTSHLLGRPGHPSSKDWLKRLLVVESLLDSGAF